MCDDRPRPEAILAQLIRGGLVTPATSPPGEPPPAPPGIMSLTMLLDQLDEARADRSAGKPSGTS
jgi:hypothetical protein